MGYNFSSKTYGFIEYHFNDAGAAKPQPNLKAHRREENAE
jgi:hypothetical protein